jgi:hypothetical protein
MWHYEGFLLSIAIAESEVNVVARWPMEETSKKRQMRWIDENVHLLAQVRYHALTCDLPLRKFAFPS